MKIKNKLMKRALSATVFAAIIVAIGLVGCEKATDYKIGAPSDLQDRIDAVTEANERAQEIADSLAAAKAAELEARLTEDIYQVGNTDNSSGWWGGHSKYYRLESNSDTVYVKFKNFTSGNHVWCNWVTAVTTDASRDTDGYSEYCIWRADNYSNFAWGTENGDGWNTANDGDTHGTQQTTNYSTMATDDDDYTDYANLMNGADCVAMVTRGGDSVYVDVKMTALSGDVLKKSWYIVENGITDEPIRVFWTIENAHLVFYKTLNPAMDVFTPEFDLDENWNSGSVDEIGGDDDGSGSTYRADVVTTITTTGGEEYTMTYFAEGLTYSGYGSFLAADGSHFVMDPTETYYCALADVENSNAWFYPYSEETIVGLEDNTTAWWSAFTNYTTIIGEGYYHYKFVNYTSGVNNWNNFAIYLTNGQSRSSAKYSECFGIRADGWDNVGASGDNFDISSYPDLDGDGDIWNDFRSYMNGATIEISIEVSAESDAESASVANMVLQPGETLK